MSGYEVINGGTKISLKRETGKDKRMSTEIREEELDDMECFHGMLLEEEVKRILPQRGDFIVRMRSGKRGAKDALLTINVNDELVDLRLRKRPIDEGILAFTLDTVNADPSCKELIRQYQMGMITYMYNGSKVMFLNPIAKQAWELRRDSIEFLQKLGEGAFGEVHSGRLKLKLGKYMNVAIKVIKKTANNEIATTELLKEGTLMRKFSHPNVVRTFGMVIERDTIMVVMELINGGGLNSYVKKNKVSMEEKASFALDIANGLAYIHDLNCIHRDIACRNCLIDIVKKQAKVSDFGLTRQTELYKIQPNDRIPIRWLAPEVLKSYEYTRAADIYAFGILVWEIFSDGATPFDSMNNAQIKEGIQKEEFRPRFPEGTPNDVLETIGKCWTGDPKKRIQLEQVKKSLAKYKRAGTDQETENLNSPTPMLLVDAIEEKKGGTGEKKGGTGEKKGGTGEKKGSGDKRGQKKDGESNKRKTPKGRGKSKDGSTKSDGRSNGERKVGTGEKRKGGTIEKKGGSGDKTGLKKDGESNKRKANKGKGKSKDGSTKSDGRSAGEKRKGGTTEKKGGSEDKTGLKKDGESNKRKTPKGKGKSKDGSTKSDGRSNGEKKVGTVAKKKGGTEEKKGGSGDKTGLKKDGESNKRRTPKGRGKSKDGSTKSDGRSNGMT